MSQEAAAAIYKLKRNGTKKTWEVWKDTQFICAWHEKAAAQRFIDSRVNATANTHASRTAPDD